MKGFRLIHAIALIGGLLFLYVPIGILILFPSTLRGWSRLGRFSTTMVCKPARQSGAEGCGDPLAGRRDGFRHHRDRARHFGRAGTERARPGRAKLLFGGLIAARW